MADDSKAKLYRQLVTSANDHAVLERMRVNGFWPARKGLPPDPASELAERAQIEQKLAQLRKQAAVQVDPDAALAAERKRRWEASKKRRAEAKLQRAAAMKTRRDAWAKTRRENIIHLGRGVSAGLQDTSADATTLRARGLPVMASGRDLAMMLAIPLGALRWLTYHRRSAAVVHYRRFEIPKKSGGTRAISAPKKRLAEAQRWVWKNILERLEVPSPAHGFVRQRSVVTNATPHTGRAVVINLDLKDFFPSITFRRVKGLFRKIGYNEHVATVLGLLCTEPPRVETTLDGKSWFVALGDRVLPQGACTSPAITNALCHRLDRRLMGLVAKHGFVYTRYADDLTISGDDPKATGKILRSVRSILQTEGFTEHPSKTKVMRRSRRQEVTGLTVNDRVSVSRDDYRSLRAILHNCAKHGMASQNREGHAAFASHLRGRVEYVCMVDPSRAPKLRAALEAALAHA